ncbi:hypothetical protein GCM10022239_24150 [Leifsonia bigeumensis]|uniref:YdhG-like domain-containing protein n=1 Tax=Leifsonella bigeumensis TaxID=433643 RepID=A0ABP7FV11_9MICO
MAGSRSKITTQPTAVPVEEFLATVTNARRLADAREIIAILRRVSGEEPVMWGPSMIGFGSYHYRYDSGHEGDAFIMGLSPRAASMSVYGLYNAYDPDPRLEELGPLTAGKSCIYIKRFEAIDRELFEAMAGDAWALQGGPASHLRLKDQGRPEAPAE